MGFESLVRRGTLVTVAVLILSVLGVVSALRIPVQMIPDLEVRTVSVRTIWPGATPQDVEREILIEQEEYLRNLPSLQRIESTATSGRAEIELEFPFGIDVTEALIRVNNALSQVASYPENVDQPRIFASSFSSNAFMFFRVEPLAGNPRGLDMDMMRDFIEDNRADPHGCPVFPESRQVQVLRRRGKTDPRGDRSGSPGRSPTQHHRRAATPLRSPQPGCVRWSRSRAANAAYLLRTIGRFEQPVRPRAGLLFTRRGDTLMVRLEATWRTLELDHFEVRDFAPR